VNTSIDLVIGLLLMRILLAANVSNVEVFGLRAREAPAVAEPWGKRAETVRRRIVLSSRQAVNKKVRQLKSDGMRRPVSGRDAVRSQIIDALEAQETKETGNEEG